jgi:feruloyl esterase
MYSSAKTSAGKEIYPGKERGSEATWTPIASTAQQPVFVALGSFQVAYSDANWDWRQFDLDRDLKVVDERLGPVLNAVNPDLSAFKSRGGKLLLYHGWNDTLIPPRNTINYYASVNERMGSNQQDWMRLFMAPGMNHCGGGVGPDRVDWLDALDKWRDAGIAPGRIVAGRVEGERTVMTRPLCPYPQVAEYDGSGSTDDASNFVCRNP